MDKTGLQPLQIEDFSGGMTDYYEGGQINKYELADNMVINENQDLITRPGSTWKVNARVSPTKKIRNIIDNQSEALVQSEKNVYSINSGFTAIQSPQSHSVFTDGTDASRADFAYWNKHSLAVSDALKPPQKIYKNDSGVWKVTQLGLPNLDLFFAITLANGIKAKHNSHVLSVAQHTSADTINQVTSPNASDSDTLLTLVNELVSKYTSHEADARAATPAHHVATVVTSYALSDTAVVTDIFTALEILKELKTKFNSHDANATSHTTASLNQITTVTNLSVSGSAGTSSYIYGFYYSYKYKVEDTEFLERGPIYLYAQDSLAATVNFTISNIPSLVSGTYNNWDDSNIKINIVRSTDSGLTLFELAQISNGTTSYADTTSDTALQLNETAYTEGGILDDEAPPPAKYITSVNDLTVFANIKEGSLRLPNKFRITKRGKPYSSPAIFFETVDDNITGAGHVGIYPIIFTTGKSFRVEGSFDESGRGGIFKRIISTKVGCVSHDSIVNTQQSIFFAAEDGFYVTDGFELRKISKDINLTYASLADKSKITGTFDKVRNRVIWSVTQSTQTGENDSLFIAHLDYTLPDGQHPFTTWSGGRDASNFSSTYAAFINSEFLRADRRGYLLKHVEDLFTDFSIDTTKDPDEWFQQTIFYDHRSVAFDFGNTQVRKWLSKVVVNANNKSSLSLQVSRANDNSGEFIDLKPIVKNGNPVWGDPTILWGLSDLRWNYFPIISEWRWMNAVQQALRCSYAQLRFTNAYIDIDDYSVIGNCFVNSVTKQITLLSYPTNDWPADPVNYFISFAYDNYAKEYKITNLGSGILTVSDSQNNLITTASTAWKIKGYKKGEILNMINYLLNYRLISMTQDTYRAMS